MEGLAGHAECSQKMNFLQGNRCRKLHISLSTLDTYLVSILKLNVWENEFCIADDITDLMIDKIISQK